MTPAAILDETTRYPTYAEEVADPAKAASHAAQAMAFDVFHRTPKPTVPLVIYHADCLDGLTAAWAVRKHFLELDPMKEVEFYAAKYQQPPPDVTGRDVIIVDFSYKRPVLLEMADKAQHVLVLDHHKSAQEDLESIQHPRLKTVFDMERSGAGMAWDWFHQEEDEDGWWPKPRPWLVNYVQDNDLWRHKLKGCKAVMEYIRSWPATFATLDMMNNPTSSSLEQALDQGTHILRFKRRLVEQTLTIAQPIQYPLPPGTIVDGSPVGLGEYVTVPILVCNVPFFLSSEVGHELAEKNLKGSGLPFGIMYYRTKDGKYSLSFRSIGDFDVSKLALVFGGGGHRNAAGATVDSLPWEKTSFANVPLL